MQPLNSSTMYVLVGTSSTGKTSIMKELELKKGTPNLKVDGVDYRRDPSVQTPPNMEKDMIDEAIYDVVNGKNVIFDLADAHVLHSQLDKKNFQGDVKIILVYCPFDEMCARMEQRSKGSKEENRIGTVPLDQFADMYGPVESGQQPLEVITKEHAKEIYMKYFDAGVAQAENLPMNNEGEIDWKIINQDREKFTANFLYKLGFTDPSIDKVSIGPKDPELYNVVVNSKDNSAEKIASLIDNGKLFKTS